MYRYAVRGEKDKFIEKERDIKHHEKASPKRMTLESMLYRVTTYLNKN